MNPSPGNTVVHANLENSQQNDNRMGGANCAEQPIGVGETAIE